MKQTTSQKTVYIPYMSDHVYVMAAALEVYKIPTEVLPLPNDETLAIGLDYCKGRECLPCFTTTGDIIHRSRQVDFKAEQAIVLMPTTAGPCRFGQYNALQRDIMDQEGLQAMEIVSPNAENSYQGFGDNPTKLRQLTWQGAVALDLLQKLLHQYRPYELNKGETDQLYQQGIDEIVKATKAGGGKAMLNAMQWMAKHFEALAIDKSQTRPIIGMVGEIYLRFNAFTNQDIIRRIEEAGGEVILASMMEWLYFTNWYYKTYTKISNMYLDFFKTYVSDLYQMHYERKLVKPIAHLLRHAHETPVAKIVDNVRPYFDPFLATEAILSMGKAIDFAKQGLSGIINVMPFSCMPGIITAGMAPRIRADLDNIPWLDIIYDAQEGTNINTRLEAFMYQAIQFQRHNHRELANG